VRAAAGYRSTPGARGWSGRGIRPIALRRLYEDSHRRAAQRFLAANSSTISNIERIFMSISSSFLEDGP